MQSSVKCGANKIIKPIVKNKASIYSTKDATDIFNEEEIETSFEVFDNDFIFHNTPRFIQIKKDVNTTTTDDDISPLKCSISQT
jgi:hypothetical protein